MELKVKRLHDKAILPTYATDGSACFDIYTYEDGLATNEGCVFSTGLAFDIPEDHVMLVFSRSGHGFNYDVRLSNCVGVIDSDYVGEVLVKLVCDKQENGLPVKEGDRIAQGMILPVNQVSFIEVYELKTTARGEGGFGSTGK